MNLKKIGSMTEAMENYCVISCSKYNLLLLKWVSGTPVKSNQVKKVIRGQLWVKLVKKESYRAVCIQYTYVLTPDLIKSIFRLKSYFSNFLDFD